MSVFTAKKCGLLAVHWSWERNFIKNYRTYTCPLELVHIKANMQQNTSL
jgi:hypothetical protein